jgi:hypothetical protein
MLAGHYSTALLAYLKFPKGTLIFFLIASQFQDLVWLTFHYLGIEPTEPNSVEEVTLQGIDVNMLFSHELLPQLFWVLAIFLIGRLLFKSNKIGVTGGLLVLGHFILDFLSGYPHHIFGEETHTIGLGLYHSNVYLAIAIEGLVSSLALFYFFKKEKEKGIERTTKSNFYITGLFVFGVVFILLIATNSLKEWFGLPNLNLMFNTTIPTLILTYTGMIFYLNYFVLKENKQLK